MMNLNEMTSKQLKELGKEHHIKNWWTMSKAALISALSETLSETSTNEPEPEVVEIKSGLTQTPPPEKIVALIDEKELKKPNLRIRELTYAGKTQTIREWAAELNMPWPTLYDRINRNGWTVEEALCTPLGERRKK